MAADRRKRDCNASCCGAVAKKYLNTYGITTKGFVSQIGSISADTVDLEFVNENKFFFPDRSKISSLEEFLRNHQRRRLEPFNIKVQNCPVGLGEPVFDKLNADLAKAIMSINTNRFLLATLTRFHFLKDLS